MDNNKEKTPEEEKREQFYDWLNETYKRDPNEPISSAQAKYYREATPVGATAEWWIENRTGMHVAVRQAGT